MYLPSYKINNSYTIYVNYAYLNECIKAGKKARSQKKPFQNYQKKLQKSLNPLENNTLLYHKKYGAGRVVSTDKDGIMKVAFDSKILHFIYPDAVYKGFLSVAQN